MSSIEFLNVNVDLLRKNTWNTNKTSVDNEQKIRKSLERNGMFKPIIVRQVPDVTGYEIIGGEHRWEQAMELGHAQVPVANLGYIDELRAKEIGVIDNARYGADDTLSFADLLKEIGDAAELQDFLPYGSADLDAIFSASSIAIDDLDIDENFDNPEENPVELEPKAPKTHTVMRFKLSLGDAERITAMIARTQKDHGYTSGDDLTNAGDAMVHLLNPQIGSTSGPASAEYPDVEAILDAALKDMDE